MKNETEIRKLLYELECRLQQPDIRSSAAELKKLLAEDFVEFGSSGRVYDRDAIIESLGEESGLSVTMTDFRAIFLLADIVLVTYRAEVFEDDMDAPCHSLRSSLWKKHSDGWRMVFHQGTPIDKV